MFNKIIMDKKNSIRLKNIRLKNIQLKTIGSITALFFLMVTSDLHACSPKGHLKFSNNTNRSVRVTLTRPGGTYACSKENPRIKCRKKNLTTINIKPYTNSPTICWTEKKHNLSSFTVSFKDGGTFKDGPEIRITKYRHSRDKKRILGLLSHTGNQKYIKSSGCSHHPSTFLATCIVDLQMAGKK